MSKKIVILGAGISGLAAAHWLNKKGFDVIVIERKAEAGGAMITESENGYLIDYGPNSGLETTPLIKELVDDIGLTEEMIYANEEGNKRYILRDDVLHALPTSPPAFIKTKLFSTKAKLRLFAEPFIGKSKDGYYQSISEFVQRRLGKEFLDYAINPFVAGVFAGNPDKLSVKSAFPKLYRLEEIYGGLIKGMFKGARERKKNAEKSKQNAKMFSFKNGMQSLPKAIARSLGDKVLFNSEIKKIKKINDRYKILFNQNGSEIEIDADIVISTLPAYKTSEIFGSFDENLSKHLNEIYYPPVMVLFLGYNKKDIGRDLDGFGFLIPEKEKKSLLGAIWSSVIFQNRAEDDKAAFTIFIGGARSPELFNLDKEEIKKKVLDEFHQIMKINGEPEFIKERMWNKAIPQYNLGYIEHENYFDEFENKFKGIILSGNYRGGISVGDCIKNSGLIAEKAEALYNI